MLKTRTWISAAAIGAAALMAGCAAGPNQQMGAGVGALGGAVVGNAIGGNTAATVGGAAIGGLVGNEIGRQRDQQNYNNQYYYPDGSRRY
ncbi:MULTISPECIES: glycine zipper domain-containing protein [Pseudacidovorax]|uniref:glycine zipper domain-containing protein n=1 Tax=Pseudacidovorax TaxID=433923 RepID=UPI001B260BE2|nr:MULTISPECIES: glycine zipper domain-containing protein [Pseudacidovorax]MBO9642602.1 glycine zipper 2TM domain-containing protein [Pseudacidovorax sp.]